MRPERGALSGSAFASICPLTLAADKVFPSPGCHSPDRERREPAARNVVRRTTRSRRSAFSPCRAARISSDGRRRIHSIYGREGPHYRVPTCASHRGVLAGTLRSSTTQRPPPERAAAPWAMTSAHSGTCDRAYVDRIASTSVGKFEVSRVGLHEADILVQPFVYPILGLGEHRVGQIDADVRPSGPIASSIEWEVQTCAACDVDHAVTRAKAKCLYGPQALRPLGVAGHGIEPGGDVVVLRLLAVRRRSDAVAYGRSRSRGAPRSRSCRGRAARHPPSRHPTHPA